MSQRTTKTTEKQTQREIVKKVDSIDKGLKTLSLKVNDVEGKVENIEGEVKILKGDVKDLKGEVQLVKLRTFSLEQKMSDVETRVDKGFAAMETKFNTVFDMLDMLAKKLDDKLDEQKAQFINYKTLDQKVEAHDKDIARIKNRLKMAAA